MVIDLTFERLKRATNKLEQLGYFVHHEPNQTVIGREGLGALATLLVREEGLKISFAVDSYGLDAAEICLELQPVGLIEMVEPFFADFNGNMYFGDEAFEQHTLMELELEADQVKAIEQRMQEENVKKQ